MIKVRAPIGVKHSDRDFVYIAGEETFWVEMTDDSLRGVVKRWLVMPERIVLL